MKKWFIFFGIVAIIIGGGYFVVSFYAVKFIQPRLQKAMGPGLTLEEMKLKATYLSVKGIRYEDPHSKQKFFQIEEVRIYPSLFSFFKKSIRIKRCTFLRPSLFFFRTQEGNFVGPGMATKKGREGKEVSEEEKKKGESIPIRIDRIRVENGSIDIEDRKMGKPAAQIKFRELDFEIREIDYPLAPSHSPFELRTKVEGKKQGGNIYAKGWLDLKTSDMETSLRAQKIEVKTFEPYYRKKVSAEIEDGYMNMESQITIKQRRIDAPGQLELNDLQIREGGTVFYIPAKTLISLLKDRGNRITVRFHVKGNMDDPQFNLRETLLTRVAISFAEVLGLPIKTVGETVFEGTGKGTGGLVEGLKSIGDLFEKEKGKKK